MTLEQVLADFREEAQILTANGHGVQAKSLHRVLDAVRAAVPGYLHWISEREAVSRSGRAASYFRARFSRWEDDGYAELRGRTRYYRETVIEREVLLSVERERARQDRRSA